MDEAVASIVAFVEGRIEPADFETRLYNDPAIEGALNDDPTLKPGTYVGTSTYLFVVEQDFESPGSVFTHATNIAVTVGRMAEKPGFSRRLVLGN